MKNRSLSFAVAVSYKELQSVEAFLERNDLNVPCCSGLGTDSTPIDSAPSPPSMYLMNPGILMASRSVTLVPLASGGVRYETNESPS
ncbi:MAG: hypothetical protein QMB42_05350 [SAR324 cluster bacterium]|jgi:hypothetical protein